MPHGFPNEPMPARKAVMTIHQRSPSAMPCVSGIALALALAAWAGAAEVEPVYTAAAMCRFKTPAGGMRFTQGIPLRLLADGIDPGAWNTQQWTEAAEVRFYADGNLVGTTHPVPGRYNYYETWVSGLGVGQHLLAVQSTNTGNQLIDGFPITITIDPLPVHANAIQLGADVVLTGSQDLRWEDAVVTGNDHTVRSAPGWTGSVVIRNSFVTGLGAIASPGIDVTTSAGGVTIAGSVFEGTGALLATVQGAGGIAVTGSEFRANNRIEFVPSNPDRSPVLSFTGPTTGSTVFQGNRVASGRVVFSRLAGVVVGGTGDQGNVLIGPRCVIDLGDCPHSVVRGNYMHHDYFGGWSQGFNLVGVGSVGSLAEHNVIRGSSWPVQSWDGEFRYNLMVDLGHNWIRTVESNAYIHHNLFINVTGPENIDAGIEVYLPCSGIVIANNTVDGGASVNGWLNPVLWASRGCLVASARNNALSDLTPGARAAFGRGRDDVDTDPRLGYADYNGFFGAGLAASPHYAAGIVAGRTLGDAGFGGHDQVAGDARFALGGEYPYHIFESNLWNRAVSVTSTHPAATIVSTAQVLAYYRARYAPAAGSPLIGHGDPADGADAFIGAIGTGVRADDLFGRFGAGINQPPSVGLLAPAGDAAIAPGADLALAARALDPDGTVAEVAFYDGATRLGAGTPGAGGWHLLWHAVPAGTHAVTVRATDNLGAVSTSPAVYVTAGSSAPAPSGAPPAPSTGGGGRSCGLGAGLAAILSGLAVGAGLRRNGARSRLSGSAGSR
jgi:hypothetical protein